MARYAYRGRQGGGVAVQGMLEASTPEAAATLLLDRGIVPIEIDPVASSAAGGDSLLQRLRRRRPGLDDLLLFSRQMHALLRAGVPVTRAIAGLLESMRNLQLATALRDVLDQLEAGRALSASLARSPRVFSALYVSMVAVGESTGRLDEAFGQLAGYTERMRTTAKNIRTALRYPSFVILAAVIAIFILNVWVIPGFARLYQNWDLELPWATRMLLAVSGFFVRYWWLLIGAVVAGLLGLRAYVRTEAGRLRWHRLLLRIPLIGDILHRAYMGRFARAFAMTHRAGVPILQGLGAVARAIDNEHVSAHVRRMREGIERGEPLTRTAAGTGMFTPVVLQMMAVGEESGALDEMLDHVADFYDQEVDYDVKALADNVEPVIYVVLGVMVLIIALGIFLPMWDLVQLAQR